MSVRRRWSISSVLVLALVTVAGCVGAGQSTAVCAPVDPVAAPRSVAPGGELHIEVTGLMTGGDCEPRLPEGARYELELRWAGEETPVSLGSLQPGFDGVVQGTVRVPEDAPAGTAEVSVNLEGAPTVCQTDPTIGCAKDPFTLVEIAG